MFISGVAFDLTNKDLFSTVTESLRISKKYFILHISNYKLDPSLNIKSKEVIYKSHFLRDYHLFFKENFFSNRNFWLPPSYYPIFSSMPVLL